MLLLIREVSVQGASDLLTSDVNFNADFLIVQR